MEPNCAGMIAFNLAGQVLITTSFGSRSEWVFPKGHIEKGELPEQTAQREILEECGIVATPLSKVGMSSFTRSFAGKEEQILVEWWTGCAVRKSREEFCEGYAEEDFRDTKWVDVHTALELLSFPDLQEMLKKALCWI